MIRIASDPTYPIYTWMKRNVFEFVDRQSGEVNLTRLVEAWDRECSNGEATLDTNHPAWNTAFRVAQFFDLQWGNK